MPAATDAENAGRRRTRRASRWSAFSGRAAIASPRRKRRRSSARAAASAYRCRGSLRRHFRQIVSRSRGTLALSRDGGTGSCVTTWYTVSAADSARNGGRPVSSS